MSEKSRDPRVDPRPGDLLRSVTNMVDLRVKEVRGESVGYLEECSDWSINQLMRLERWCRYTKHATVIKSGDAS